MNSERHSKRYSEGHSEGFGESIARALEWSGIRAFQGGSDLLRTRGLFLDDARGKS
jgi:hypothetical protein